MPISKGILQQETIVFFVPITKYHFAICVVHLGAINQEKILNL